MASSNQNPAQNAPQKKHIFLNHFLPIIVGAVGLVGGWYLNAYMMPPNKDAKELIKTQTEQVQATREGFNKLADAIQRNNMTDIVNNVNVVGAQLDGLSSTTNKFLAEYKLPVVKVDSVQKVVVVNPNPNPIDTVKPVSLLVAVTPNREIRIKIGDKNAVQIDKANYVAVLGEDQETGKLQIMLNGFNYGRPTFDYGGKVRLIPVDKIQQELLYKGKDETKSYYIFHILDPVK